MMLRNPYKREPPILVVRFSGREAKMIVVVSFKDGQNEVLKNVRNVDDLGETFRVVCKGDSIVYKKKELVGIDIVCR